MGKEKRDMRAELTDEETERIAGGVAHSPITILESAVAVSGGLYLCAEEDEAGPCTSPNRGKAANCTTCPRNA